MFHGGSLGADDDGLSKTMWDGRMAEAEEAART